MAVNIVVPLSGVSVLILDVFASMPVVLVPMSDSFAPMPDIFAPMLDVFASMLDVFEPMLDVFVLVLDVFASPHSQALLPARQPAVLLLRKVLSPL